jgi:hypothetical protein
MTTKRFAIMLSLCFAVAFSFTGCESVRYVAVPCAIEAPTRLYTDKKCEGDDFAFAKCVLVKKEALISDYNNLRTAFEACK